MKFLRNIFKSKETLNLHDSARIQKEIPIAQFINSSINNDVPALNQSIADLIYQRKLDESKINKYLDFQSELDFSGSGWSQKGDFNIPGPFYTGESDTCGTGLVEAPNNVIFDENCLEYVLIQPRTKIELLQLCNAGATEVFGAYYCDGNKHWTIQSVKNWWANRYELLEHINNNKLVEINFNQEKRYRYYLENNAKVDLRKYCFFLDNGYFPTSQSVPEID